MWCLILADGYNRAESSVSFFLQNKLDAKRSYCTLVNIKMEQHGGLRGVLTDHSTEYFRKIIMETYEEAGIDPATVAYVEADGYAIKVPTMSINIFKNCNKNQRENI